MRSDGLMTGYGGAGEQAARMQLPWGIQKAHTNLVEDVQQGRNDSRLQHELGQVWQQGEQTELDEPLGRVGVRPVELHHHVSVDRVKLPELDGAHVCKGEEHQAEDACIDGDHEQPGVDVVAGRREEEVHAAEQVHARGQAPQVARDARVGGAAGDLHFKRVDRVEAHVAPLADRDVLAVLEARASQRVVHARKDVLGDVQLAGRLGQPTTRHAVKLVEHVGVAVVKPHVCRVVHRALDDCAKGKLGAGGKQPERASLLREDPLSAADQRRRCLCLADLHAQKNCSVPRKRSRRSARVELHSSKDAPHPRPWMPPGIDFAGQRCWATRTCQARTAN
eukprot:363803-Chlamydomonas_euryale.AAC.14